MKFVLACGALVVAPVCFASGGMDHINPVGSNLVSTATFGRVQVFTDTPEKSRMVVDDFYADKGVLDSAAFAYELTNSPQIGHPNGWRISVWSSLADAINSDNSFTANTVATGYVAFAASNWAITGLSGTGTQTASFRIDFTNLGLNIGTGVRYIGIAPEQSSSTVPNWLICGHNSPSVLGNGTANDSYGINPSGALGNGTGYLVGTNASYAVGLVPEPSTLAILAAGAGFLAKRRRKLTK